MAKLKVPDINKMLEEYEKIKSSYSDFIKIISVLPIDSFSSDNIEKLENSLNNLKKISKTYLKAMDDDEFLFDMFKGGGESIGFCKKIKLEEDKLYEMKKTFEKILVFDLKEFILNRKN